MTGILGYEPEEVYSDPEAPKYEFVDKDLGELPMRGAVEVTPEEVELLRKMPDPDWSRLVSTNMWPKDFHEGGDPLVFYFQRYEEARALQLLANHRGSTTFRFCPAAVS